MSKHITPFSTLHGPSGRVFSDWIVDNIGKLWDKTPDRLINVANTASLYTADVPNTRDVDGVDQFQYVTDKLYWFTPHIENDAGAELSLNGKPPLPIRTNLSADIEQGLLSPLFSYLLLQSPNSFLVISNSASGLFEERNVITPAVDTTFDNFPAVDRLTFSFRDVVLADPWSELYVAPIIDGVLDEVGTYLYNDKVSWMLDAWSHAANYATMGISVTRPTQDDFTRPLNVINGELIFEGLASPNWKTMRGEVICPYGAIIVVPETDILDTSTGWTADTGWTMVGGVGIHNGTNGSLRKDLPAPTGGIANAVGKYYRFTYDLVVTTGGNGFAPVLIGATIPVGTTEFTSGRKVTTILAPALSGGKIVIGLSAGATFVGSLPNGIRIEGPVDRETDFDAPTITKNAVSLKTSGRITGLVVRNVVPSVGYGAGIKSGRFMLRAN